MRFRKRNVWVSFGCLAVVSLAATLAVWALRLPAAPAAENVGVPALPEKPTAEFCLNCHGPFEALANRTAGYVTDQNEKANPHMYVPHESRKITVCTSCHDVHPLPMPSPGKAAKATVQYCYSACHHKNDFTPCVNCHKDKK